MTVKSVKKQLSLFAEFIEAFSRLLIKMSEIEKEGLPITRFYDKEYWSEIGKHMYNALSKEEFISLMGIWYELGKFSAVDVTKLNTDERLEMGNSMKKYAQQIKELLGD